MRGRDEPSIQAPSPAPSPLKGEGHNLDDTGIPDGRPEHPCRCPYGVFRRNWLKFGVFFSVKPRMPSSDSSLPQM